MSKQELVIIVFIVTVLIFAFAVGYSAGGRAQKKYTDYWYNEYCSMKEAFFKIAKDSN